MVRFFASCGPLLKEGGRADRPPTKPHSAEAARSGEERGESREEKGVRKKEKERRV
jgi:hypothetical protein